MRHQLITGCGAVVTLILSSSLPILSEQTVETRGTKKERAIAWSAEVPGRHYYLNAPRGGLLTNDQVNIVRCQIRYKPQTNLDTGEVHEGYRAKLWFEGASPAPPRSFRMTVNGLTGISDLDKWLIEQFSATPLENAFEWPPHIKRAVRYRYVALGMNKDMVDLILGGLGYQVDLEQLDDGRIRETWKLQVTGDNRTIFMKRSAFMKTVTSQEGSARATTSSFSESTSSTTVEESGFFIFSGLPPQVLNIVFTNGKVTARRTEYIK